MMNYVVIRVLKAQLIPDQSSHIVSRNYCYAEVNWISPVGETLLISKTRSIKNDKCPVWDFMCAYGEFKDSGEKIQVSVRKKLFQSFSVLKVLPKSSSFSTVSLGSSTYSGSPNSTRSLSSSVSPISVHTHGTTIIDVCELLSKSKEKAQKYNLKDSNGLRAGEIFLFASLIELHDCALTDANTFNESNQRLFETPVKRLGVSGGTAPFFELILKNPENLSPTYYIGKDLAHASDELNFYETVKTLKQHKKETGFGNIMEFMFEYKGVYKATQEGVNNDTKMELLVMRNLNDGKKALRLLDFKIGYKTASAGWQGKSLVAAMRQRVLLDSTTNSTVEGFRLEGFDGMPKSLFSRDPTLDGHVLDRVMDKSKAEKKSRRHALQSLTGIKIMPFYVDLSELREKYENNDEDYYSPDEVSEIVLLETVSKLTRLSKACQSVLIAQKWIGSSVAIGFDCGDLPLRSKGEKDIRDKVLVNIFDWGRSTLTLVKEHDQMTVENRKDYAKFWNYYKAGIRHLAWDAAHYYYHRFGNTTTWKHLTITLKDYDGLTAHDLIGMVELPFREMDSETHQINLRHKHRGTLTCSMSWKDYPPESRLKGAWSIFIERADDIPNLDQGSLSDAYCIITAESENGHTFDLYSSVIGNNLFPVWNETFEVPIMKSNTNLCTALKEEGLSFDGSEIIELFPVRKMVRRRKISKSLDESDEECLERWKKILHCV